MAGYSDRLLGLAPSSPAAPIAPAAPASSSYADRLLGLEPSQAAAPAAPDRTWLQALDKGTSDAMQGFSDFAAAGYADEAEAKLRSSLGGEDYDQAVADVRQRQENAGWPWYLGAAVATLTPGGLASLGAKGAKAIASGASRLVGQRAAPYVGAAGAGAVEGAIGATGGAEGGLGERLEAAPAGAAFGAAGGAAGQAIGQGLNRWANRRVARDIQEMSDADVSRLQALSKQYGIQLTPAELTNLPSLQTQQKLLINNPGASETMARFYRNRAGNQVEPAVDKMLDSIAPFQGVDDAAAGARDAAKASMQQLAEERAAKASPIYRKAFDAGTSVDVKPVLKEIDAISKRFPKDGKIRKQLGHVAKLLTVGVNDQDKNTKALLQAMAGPGKKLPDRLPMDDLEVLHGAKLEIDDLIAQARAKVEKGGGKTSIAILGEVQEQLLRAMDKASPDYATARGIFGDLSPGVDQVREGVAGVIAGLPDTQLRLAAGKIFNKNQVSVTGAMQARRHIQEADPLAWQAIKRAFVEEQWIKATQEAAIGQGEPINAGARFRKQLFGNRRQKDLLRAVMEPAEFQQLGELSELLEATGRVKALGSDTAWNQEAQRAMKADSRGFWSSIIGSINFDVLKDVSARLDQVGYREHTEKLAAAITSPEGLELLKELKRITPNQKYRRAILGYALGMGPAQAGAQAVGGAYAGSNAESLPQRGMVGPGVP